MSAKPDSLRSKLRAALAGITSSLGATNEELKLATGMDAVILSRVVHCLSKSKQIHMVHRGRHTRYFATQEARDAAVPEVNAMADAIKTATRAINDARKAARYYERIKARPPKPARAPKPPKIVKPAKAKMCMPANVTVKARASHASFKDQSAIIPPHVKVQVCPSGKDTRFTFHPPKGWIGEISKQWSLLKGGK
jgi:hypothetical protein